MASEEQINNQQRLNDLRQEELSYIQESEEFIASTISKSAQLADTIKSQLASIREKTTLDQKILQFSKQNVDVLSKLKVDYQDIAKVDKDRKGILDQIQKNNNVINAQGQDLSKEVKEQAKAFVEQEKALSDQQKILAEKIDKQEQLVKIIKAQEAAGKKVDMADRALLKNAQESTRLQQMKVAGIQAEVLEAGRVADPLAVSLALLQDQNAQLDEAVGYLDDEEEAIINVEKAQGLFNISLGAAGKLLKKAGLESSALYLGLGKGAEAAEEAANRLTEGGTRASTFGDRIKVLGAGIAGTFKGMANEIKAIGIGALLFKGIKGAFNMLGGKVITGFLSDLKSKFTSGISYLKDQFFSLNSYIDDAKAGDAFNQRMSKATADIATNIGVSTKNARELVTQAGKVSASLGMMPEELAATTAELQKSFGTTQRFSDDTVKTMGQLTNLLGLSNEEAAEFVKLSQLSGEEASDTTLTYKTQIQALKERENIAISEKEIMKEIAKSSAAQQLTFRGSGKSLAEAAFHAKKLGLSLQQTEAIGGSLLEFESSIANEMEAELMLGRDLNLERARSAALEGDLATVAKEVAGQIGSAAEFGKMNVLQQEALAKSVGVSRDELANMLKTQELLAGTGFDEMSDAQEQFKKLLKETGSEEAALAKMREMGASDALQAQLRQVSLEEKRALQQRAVEAAQGRLANAVNKVFDAFKNVNAIIKNIKAVIVKEMKPFFDSFGGLVGKGGKAFEKDVLPYAKQLGKFMNDVGLRLVDIVKNNGPQIKAIFSGVLELFGSIYNVVGGVIKQLLGIKESGASSKGFFESIRDTISVMIEKLQNVDITALTEKVKGFIDGVKNIFKFIFDKVGAIGDFLGKNKGITKMAGLGAFAFTVAPGAVKDIAGSVGSAITKKAAGGLKTLGSNLGNKLTEKLGLGKLFGKSGGEKPTGGSSDPLFVQNVGEGAGGGLMDMVGKMGGRKAGIGGGFKKGFKGLMDYAKMAMKGGRAGKVGRARLLRAGKGLITGQGASFVGGTGKGSAQAAKAAGKLGGIASKLGSVGKGLGKLAAGGGIGAIVGIAAEQTLGVFQRRAEAAAGALDEQIAMTDDATKSTELEAQRQKKLRAAQNLEIAGTTAKYAGLGATIGSVIPGVGTAVGAAVGAVVGFAVGLKNAAKERKYQATEEAKFQKNYRRLQIRNAKDNARIEQNALRLKLEAEKEAAKASLQVQQEFSNLDGTNEAFTELAQKMLDAGNITEEQFTQAIKGTLSPLELMNAASATAASNLKELYDVVGKAADEQAQAARDKAFAEAGTNEAIIESQKNLINSFRESELLIEESSKALFDKFGEGLKDGIDTAAVEALRGTDEDSAGFAEALTASLKDATGQSDEAIRVALEGVAAKLEREGEDFDLDSQEDVAKLQEMVAERLLQGVDAQAQEAIKAGNQANIAIQEFGIDNAKTIANLTKSGLETNMGLQEAVAGLEGGNEALAAALAEGGDIQAFRTFLTGAAGALSATDATAAQAIVDAIGTAETADDFILRPGQPALKFNKDDLVIGGTNLEGGSESSSEETSALKQELQEMKQMMASFVEQMGQVVNRPIVLEMNGNKVGQALGQNSYRVQ